MVSSLSRGFALSTQRQKLVAPVAIHIVRAEGLDEQLSGLFQYQIAHGVAVGVVDALEIVQVQHQHVDVTVFKLVVIPPQGEPVAHAGEGVALRRLLQRELVEAQQAVHLLQPLVVAQLLSLQVADGSVAAAAPSAITTIFC